MNALPIFRFVTLTIVLFGIVSATRIARAETIPAQSPHQDIIVQDPSNRVIFVGTMTTQVLHYNIYGMATGRETYTNPEQVIFSRSMQDASGYFQESNPFHLIIDRQTPGLFNPGEVLIGSAATNDGVLFQYWDLRMTGNSTFEGELTTPHNAEAFTVNNLSAPMEVALHISMTNLVALAKGTTMQGELVGNTLHIVIQGNSIGGNTPFVAEFVGQIVQ